MATTAVKTGLVRFSYPAVFSPKASGDSGDLKYSVSIIIPKKDKETLAKIREAIEEAYAQGKSKKGFTMSLEKAENSKSFSYPFKDGDEREDEDPAYEGSYYITANSNNKPGLIDKYKEAITNPDQFYAGCYGRVTVNFYPFAVSGNKGIACGLNNIQKLKDGDRLDGRKNADKDFDDDYADSYLDDDDDYTPIIKNKKQEIDLDDL